MAANSQFIPKTPAAQRPDSPGSRRRGWLVLLAFAVAIACYVAFDRFLGDRERGSNDDGKRPPALTASAEGGKSAIEQPPSTSNNVGDSPRESLPDASASPSQSPQPPQELVRPTSPDALPAATRRTLETPAERDGWDAEVFNDAADKQLKKLAAFISAAKPVEAAAFESLATADVTATDLSARQLEETFRDATFQVGRAAGDQAVKHRGIVGLAAALNDLIASLGDEPHIHAKFKTVSVDIAGDTATTTMVMQIGGPTATGSVQWNAQCRCTWRRTADKALPLLASIAASDFENIVATADIGGMFADCTTAVLGANASFASQLLLGTDHWTGNLDERLGIDVGGWQGIAVADVNGDALEDIYVCQPGGLPNRLYVQNADGTATDVSATAGVDLIDATHAALFSDFDNDGDQDLAVAVWEGVAFFANDGRGRFTPAGTALMPASFAYSLASSDYDRDGDLDLFVCGYNPRPGVERHILFARPVPYHDANNGGRNVLLRNDGPRVDPRFGQGFRFKQVTKEVGLDENNRRFSYAAAWGDYDNDGDDDLFVANDFGRDNLYRNDAGRFRDVAGEAGVDDIGPGMSACWGDYDNDGDLDLYVANMFSSAGNRVTKQAQFLAGADAKTLEQLRHHARGNSLYRNLGNGKFQDVSLDAAVTLGRWAWGSKFVDLNNDGWEDIYVANGFITQEDTGDL